MSSKAFKLFKPILKRTVPKMSAIIKLFLIVKIKNLFSVSAYLFHHLNICSPLYLYVE